MSEEMILGLARQTLETALLVSAPMLAAGLIVGVIISVVQIITSIHDTALAFVPRIVVTFVVFLIVFPWMMATMVSYTHTLLASFQPYVR
ncbi:MAG: EscS/YscS/HrcS family type III secretion system export apparatus protein [Acidobacteria bacterium 13_1_40CM_3_56_11]|nr:MAG: EscS/YscS/HrcS family type III secretion system export apparatus protein [Acidobacteria bacterium 13_1_40CM_56_16]OLD19494.1 MAG: EscS/YscS/HrcS family type III secretion system export apparatus protein [Acidobacteria bacterium 13_1_40CM_3_56_11]OLD71089.1 MAG: EscS/YscS/HrcS family type III secretion system export apparatus protein [Acidobacteria bacterium 13_1_40CM_2_56_11]